MFDFHKILIIILEITIASCLTCNDILQAPDTKKWSVVELQGVKSNDIVECLAHLSKEKMPLPEAQYIWNTLVKFYEGAPNIPEDKLILLHWVTLALEPDDYNNMTLNNIDVIENFGLNYNLSPAQLNAIANRIREDWGGKEPEDYSYFDLMALRQILCAYNRSEIERIRPSAYKEAAAVLGKLENCEPEVLKGFATLAVTKAAFGSPHKWSDSTKNIIGVVMDHLPGGAKQKMQQR